MSGSVDRSCHAEQNEAEEVAGAYTVAAECRSCVAPNLEDPRECRQRPLVRHRPHPAPLIGSGAERLEAAQEDGGGARDVLKDGCSEVGSAEASELSNSKFTRHRDSAVGDATCGLEERVKGCRVDVYRRMLEVTLQRRCSRQQCRGQVCSRQHERTVALPPKH